jgi:hypothetical protein
MPVVLVGLAAAALQGSAPQVSVPDPNQLPPAAVWVDSVRGVIEVELPGIPLPPHLGHHGGDAGYPPVVKVIMPVSGSLYGFEVSVVDAHGRPLPAELLHHFNLIDPGNRELFLPIARRVLAAGKETGPQRLPRLLFGVPIQAGTVLVASAMLHNPTDVNYPEARTRLTLRYVRAGRWFPLFDGVPFQLDVGFPVGDKSFPLPPGKSSRSYEARPSVPGRIVAIGGHVHELATRIELVEVETGREIWSAAPILDERKNVVGVPVGKLYGLFKIGAAIRPDRTYRVTVHYDNPTGATIPAGGMGVVGGLFLPERGVTWPAAEVQSPLYIQDARHFLRVDRGTAGGHHH